MLEINNTLFNPRYIEYIKRYKYEHKGVMVYKIEVRCTGRTSFDEFEVGETKWNELIDFIP